MPTVTRRRRTSSSDLLKPWPHSSLRGRKRKSSTSFAYLSIISPCNVSATVCTLF